MPRVFTIKDNSEENRLFFNRIISAFIIIVLLTLGLIARLAYLQIVGHQFYATKAKENSIKIEPTVPSRGIIYDKHGNILAENTQTYSLELIPEQVPDINETLLKLKGLLSISDEKIDQFEKLRKRQKRYTKIPLLVNMTEEEVAKFAVVRPFFRGVDVHISQLRHYPYGDLASHVVGYVGRINEAELKELPIAEYRGSTFVGKLGIEDSYETELHGKTGYAEIETNVEGRPLKTLKEIPPTSGANLHLTLDADLQKTAYDALENFNGAVVAIDIPTGGVLVFASRPGFDPNPFVVGIASSAYKELQASPDQPLYNRALRGLYPPGSTFKPFVALAGLENNAITANQPLHCPGYYQLPNDHHHYRDWKKSGHGSVSMVNAITQSCDVYFYRLAGILGIDRLHDFLQKFGFGEKSGIDLVGEKAGLMPSREWKLRRKKQPWFPGETLITGIGQGYMQVTPLQLAQATAILANRGKVVTPHLVNKITSNTVKTPERNIAGVKIPLQSDHIDTVITGMVNVVHSGMGTAKRISNGINYKIAGKTGTAQVFNIKQNASYNENQIDFKLRDHALFISFAPADNPKIAVAVIAENGGHGGSVAAPIAAKVIQQYLGNPPTPSSATMKIESRSEEFQSRSLISHIFGKLHIDIPLLLILLILSLLSFVILYSAGNQNTGLLVRQALRVGLAFILMTGLAHISPYQFKRYSSILFGIGVILLIGVLAVGYTGKGATRWLDLGFFRFQPSEMIKITTPMMMAWYLADHSLPPKPNQLIIAVILILIPTLLIAKQPDLGTAILVASSGAAVLFFAGLSWLFIMGIFAGLAALAPIVWHYFMHDYQRARIITLLDPEADPLGKGYHIIQSKIAIGSGGVYGKGWLGSKQSELEFLPESSTDFIFAVFAEEFGLFGCLGLLTLYLLVIGRCFYIAVEAQDTYSRLLAGSLAFTFFVYVFVNVGMVIGVLPVVGVPLPMISYGGTSIVTLMAGFGILMSIHTHKNFIPD